MQKFQIHNKNLEKIELRNEKKLIFLETESYLLNFFKFLKFREIFQKRKINSIYFETKNFDDLLDTIDGEKNRSKLRMRWYGETFNCVIEPILENKIKINNKNYKKKQNLKETNISNEISITEIKKIINNIKILDNHAQIKYNTRDPNILLSYDRRYFMFKNIRITLDTNLRSCNFYRKKKISKNDFFIKKKFSIVEFKYHDNEFEEIKKLSENFKNRFTKFSKYENSLINF